MSSMTQEEINVDLFDEVKRLKAENRKIKEELKLVLEPKSCDGCKNAVFPLPQICFNCERKSADLYEAKDK